MRVGK